MNPRLSVVVPVGPGDDAWQGLLPQLAALPGDAQLRLVACRAQDAAHDVLAAATDLPRDRAWLLAPRSRAAQMNAGARVCGGEWLWFLHADSRFDDPSAALAALGRTIVGDSTAIGYFDLRFAGDGPAATAINAVGAWIRSRWLRLPFGDQGLFVARATFDRLGGYDESLSAAEDHALVWAARRAGVPLRAAGASIRTSARRYAEQGWLRTTARHLALTWRQVREFSRPGGGS
jgi:rSAM/selenodomain-associated transferase 2